jgi:NADH:ubiquinone oxidoreductase subunit 5 (subunit L)/multisubunit Na+/H+ antiporter MnhA subunit
MINAGILGWLRFLPLGRVQLPAAALLFIGTGVAASFYGIILGLARKKPTEILAGSSISQMGLMTATVGLGLLRPELGKLAVPVVLLFSLHHALAKTSLFLSCRLPGPLWSGKKTIPAVGLSLPILALAGFPVTSGWLAKTAIKEVVHLAGPGWAHLAGLFFPLSSIATTVLLLHFARILFEKNDDESRSGARQKIAWWMSLVAVAAAVWFWPLPLERPMVDFSLLGLFKNAWPFFGGVLVYALLRKISASGFAQRKEDRRLPIGEARIFSVVSSLAKRISEATSGKKRKGYRKAALILDMQRGLRKMEKIFGRWIVVGSLYLLLTLLLFSLP